MPSKMRIIVIGASAGGVEAIRDVVARLPKNLEAAVFIALHIGTHKSELPKVLGYLHSLPAKHAANAEGFVCGQIYVAPPDHHMLVENDKIRLTKGLRENWSRPAIDPLFRSAAANYGSRVIGVVLSGALNDGTAGLFEIKAKGGITIVQDPSDAVQGDMPRSALDHVVIDHVLPASEIGRVLAKLTATPFPPENDAVKVSLFSQEQEMGMHNSR